MVKGFFLDDMRLIVGEVVGIKGMIKGWLLV